MSPDVLMDAIESVGSLSLDVTRSVAIALIVRGLHPDLIHAPHDHSGEKHAAAGVEAPGVREPRLNEVSVAVHERARAELIVRYATRRESKKDEETDGEFEVDFFMKTSERVRCPPGLQQLIGQVPRCCRGSPGPPGEDSRKTRPGCLRNRCALVEQRHMVAGDHRLGHVVSDDQGSEADLALVSGDHGKNRVASQRVEAGGGFVEKDELRARDDRTGQGETLLHASGKLAWVTGRSFLDLELPQGFEAAQTDFPVPEIRGLFQREGDIFQCRQRIEERVALKRENCCVSGSPRERVRPADEASCRRTRFLPRRVSRRWPGI